MKFLQLLGLLKIEHSLRPPVGFLRLQKSIYEFFISTWPLKIEHSLRRPVRFLQLQKSIYEIFTSTWLLKNWT